LLSMIIVFYNELKISSSISCQVFNLFIKVDGETWRKGDWERKKWFVAQGHNTQCFMHIILITNN
ncbi:MAG: hypothetical protein ACRDBG_21680, partial [Waterburya sp.]